MLEIISCPPEASSDHSGDTKVELSLFKKALLEGNKHVVDINRKIYVAIGEWMKIEPCLPHLVGGESIGLCAGYMCLTSPSSCSVYFCGSVRTAGSCNATVEGQ